MRRSGIGLLALALIGVCACGRKGEQKAGETTTTGGETPSEHAAREGQPSAPGAAPVSPQANEEPKTAKEEAGKKAEGAGKKAERKGVASRPMVKKTVIVKKVIRRGATEREPTSTTTITEVEIVPSKPQKPPSETPATPPGGMPLPVPLVGTPYVNHSTVLGDGKSGMYTDGQGTYGGRATWGTGGGIPPFPAVPPTRNE